MNANIKLNLSDKVGEYEEFFRNSGSGKNCAEPFVHINGDEKAALEASSLYVDYVSKKSYLCSDMFEKRFLKPVGFFIDKLGFGKRIRVAGKGCFAVVYKIRINDKDCAVKVGSFRSAVPEKEYTLLKMLSGSGAAPEPVSYFLLSNPLTYSNPVGCIIMEYLNGATLYNFLVKHKPKGKKFTEVEGMLESMVDKFDKWEVVAPFDCHSGNIMINRKEMRAKMVDLCSARGYNEYRSYGAAQKENRRRLNSMIAHSRSVVRHAVCKI